MKQILDAIGEIMADAFKEAGYDEKYAKVTLSNRPDLCEYQCNGAMAAAKEYHKAPIMIAGEVVAKLGECKAFSEINAIAPGFINIKLSNDYLCDYVFTMSKEDKFGLEMVDSKKIIVDYGGDRKSVV